MNLSLHQRRVVRASLSIACSAVLWTVRPVVAEDGPPPAPPPLYHLELERAPFLLLNRVVSEVLVGTGGRLAYEVELTGRDSLVMWSIRTRDVGLLEGWRQVTIARSNTLLERARAGALDATEHAEVATLPALLAALTRALGDPTYDLFFASGRVRREAETLLFETGDGTFTLVGDGRSRAAALDGRQVVVRGHVKRDGELTVRHVTAKRGETLEAFIMSHCPVAQELFLALEPFLLVSRADRTFAFDVRYIFYETEGVVSALHGPEEFAENCLQMRVRDIAPEAFAAFLAERLSAPEGDWRTAARRAGMSEAEMRAVDAAAGADSARVRGEIAYVREANGVVDGSPTFYWEGEPVRLDRSFAPLERMGWDGAATTETCRGP